jgi:hypothetical protein
MAYMQYQQRDHDVVDYQLWELQGFPYMLRGPRPEGGRPRVAILGAGQSLGVLVRRPFADMMREAYGVDVLNLSVGGSAPRLYLNNPVAFEHVNAARACIVQVLSARSTDCSYFQTRDGKNMMRPRGSTLPYVPGDTAWDAMFRNEPPRVAALVVAELQRNWVDEMIAVLDRITVPKVLLWFSKRSPGKARPITGYRAASGVYPQFVDGEMVRRVAAHADHYVEVSSARGMPNRLVNRFTGQPARVILGDARRPAGEDSYYPSPEMHEDAFAALSPTLDGLLKGTEG